MEEVAKQVSWLKSFYGAILIKKKPHIPESTSEKKQGNAKELVNSNDKVLPQSFFSLEARSLKSIGMERHLDSNGPNNKDF